MELFMGKDLLHQGVHQDCNGGWTLGAFYVFPIFLPLLCAILQLSLLFPPPNHFVSLSHRGVLKPEQQEGDFRFWISVLPGEEFHSPGAWEANSQGCFLPANKKLWKTGTKILLFHPFPTPVLCKEDLPKIQSSCSPKPIPAWSEALWGPGEVFLIPSGSPQLITPQLISSLGFQDFQTQRFNRTRISNTSCPEGCSCHSCGEFLPPQSILWELGNTTEPLLQSLKNFINVYLQFFWPDSKVEIAWFFPSGFNSKETTQLQFVQLESFLNFSVYGVFLGNNC